MKAFKSFITEGRPSQRHPLEGHPYHRKSDAELKHIAKDAHEAAEAMKGHNERAENKYRDQANDSATVRYWRQKNGTPDWYKKKYGHVNEQVNESNYEVDVTHSHLSDDGKRSEKKYTYDVKNALTVKHAKNIAMEKHRNKVGLGKGENFRTNSMDVRLKEGTEQIEEVAAWQRKEGKSESGGLNRKGIESYRRENPGSKLSMAVTTKPSKLKPGSKAANRRKSFCARMGGMKKRLTSAETARDPDSRINKALRKWNC